MSNNSGNQKDCLYFFFRNPTSYYFFCFKFFFLLFGLVAFKKERPKGQNFWRLFCRVNNLITSKEKNHSETFFVNFPNECPSLCGHRLGHSYGIFFCKF